MKPRKRITKELIRQYFGSRAKVTGSGGHYRVTTQTGGEVVFRPRTMTILRGGDDVYKAVMLMGGEIWGCVTAKGSREFILGAVAHGEAWGVPVKPNFKDRGTVARRNMLALGIIGAGCWLGVAQESAFMPVIAVLIAAMVFACMARIEKQDEQSKAEALGFHYPRVDGSAGDASRDDLQKKGWL